MGEHEDQEIIDESQIPPLKITLHIKLDITHGTEDQTAYIDQILFQIIFNKAIAIDNGFLIVDKISNFEIEVSNTFKGMLLQDLSVINIVLKKEKDREGRLVRTNLPRIFELNKI